MRLVTTIRFPQISNIPFNPMTSEQLKRIEENRQKALELKSKSKLSTTTISPHVSPSKHSFPPHIHNPYSTKSPSNKWKKFANKTDEISPVVFSLKDENHFLVETKHNKNLISIFKRTPVWSYDPESKNWSFPLSNYKSLISQIEKNCPDLKLEQIPQTILTVLTEKYKDVDLQGSDIPQDLMTTLLPYQVDGVKFCIARNGRAIIADEMGLGKTIQAIAVACYLQLKWPLLIMCPSSLRLNWKEQLIKWVNWLDEDSIHVPFSSAEFAEDLMSLPITILSYDLVVKLMKIKMKRDTWKYSILIADESHFLKNSKSERTKAALPLLKSADHVLLLTGTPALSRPMELYPQITAVDKKFKISNFQFAKRYCNAKETPWGWDNSGASRLAELQIYLNKRVMIRRNKTEVLPSLPSKTRKTIIIKLEESTLKALKQGISELGSIPKQDRYGCMLELFAKTANAKANSVCSYLIKLIKENTELEEKGDSDDGSEHSFHSCCSQDKRTIPFKVIVFFHHKIMGAELEQTLLANKIGFVKIVGATPPTARQAACDSFQHGDPVVALLSLKAAGTGLTLTAARIVVFAELFWNPGDLRQAEDRAHRLGQNENVEIQYLVARGTIDDKIWPLLQKKIDVLSQAGLANNTETDSFDANTLVSELFNSQQQQQQQEASSSQQRTLQEFFVSSPKRIKIESSQESIVSQPTSNCFEKFDSVEVNDIFNGDWSD